MNFHKPLEIKDTAKMVDSETLLYFYTIKYYYILKGPPDFFCNKRNFCSH